MDGLYEINEDFLFLIQSGIAKLRDVTLEKRELRQRVRISDASSGEQSVVMAMLGIASQIEDHTLVCIDEPEVCLHPEWQERYIDLLVTAFSNYTGCQFIIATHSPQIVSNLPERNCNIMSMETGQLESSREYQHRSADYQLAAIFKAPGHRNEYLNRIALNTFVKVGKNKSFDHEDTDTLELLSDSLESIRTNDPLYDLVIALQEMYKKYG
ncbi:AAA family ATPase [Vibrio parahaemolyticus]